MRKEVEGRDQETRGGWIETETSAHLALILLPLIYRLRFKNRGNYYISSYLLLISILYYIKPDNT